MNTESSGVINTLPGLVWTALPDGEVDFLNQRWWEYTGLRVDELLDRGWQSVIHPDDVPSLLESWHSLVVSGDPGELEARVLRFDGVYRSFLFRACPLADASGQIVGWCGMGSDMDGQTRADDGRSERWWLSPSARANHFRLVLDGLPVLISLMTPAGELAFANRQLLDYFGATLEELKARPIADSSHPDDRAATLAAWNESVATGHVFELEGRLRRADGGYRWFRTNGFPLRDTEGRIVLWYVLQTDVDDRKRAEALLATERARSDATLRRSAEFLAQGQHLSSTGTFSWRVATDEVTWSDETYRMFGFDTDTTVTLELIHSRVHPDDLPMFVDMLGRAHGGGSDFEYEHRLLMPDQSIRYLHMVGRASRDQDDQLEYIGAVQDITERRLSEEALGRARSELAHVARVTSLGALTASIAHEVNQPLSGIITNASTCLRMLAADPPNIDGALETARRTIRDGHRASDVIARLRALFSKKEPTTEAVDLNEATREVIALSLSELQRNRVVLRSKLEADIPPVTGDRVQLQQVILNLILNASDAMHDVDDRPRQLLISTQLDESDSVRLTVRDAGVGFGPQGADKVFEAFYTTKSDGMGIGLSVSRSIIESHHGRLWAAPNAGPGATLSFSIPRVSEGRTGTHSPGAERTPSVTAAQHV